MSDYAFRFGGIARLYGIKASEKLLNSHVLVIGLGGVGSWALESLARSGVGELTLVDLDEVCASNINRQIHATVETVGQSKAEVLGKRLKSINPDLKLHLKIDFFTDQNADGILQFADGNKYSFVLDAIDSLKYKILLFNKCQEYSLPLLVIGAAGGKKDPREIKISDLGLSVHDNLLFQMRKKLRRVNQLEKGRGKLGVDCVFSSEKCVYPDGEGGICDNLVVNNESALKLDCYQGFGSASFLTGSFGLMAAYHIIEKILAVHDRK